MRPIALPINTACGKLVDEAVLIRALEAKKLAGYGAEVLADELSFTPSNARSRLVEDARSHANGILTSRIGRTRVEARAATDVLIAKNLRAPPSSPVTPS